MNIVSSTGREDIARVFIGELGQHRLVEFVESVQPPIPREEKWVLIVSTLLGCPVGCGFCDAGGGFRGKLSAAEILSQIDFLVKRRYPDGTVPVQKFKLQFARMGEPALNPAVLEVLESLPSCYQAPGLIPSISTVAPAGTEEFFEKLLEIKEKHYQNGSFQLQFSLHSTDEEERDRLVPVKKWSFGKIAAYGERFHRPGDRKITLNFALASGAKLDPEQLLQHFHPSRFLIKITPLNPTYRAKESGLSSYLEPRNKEKRYEMIEALETAGYDVIVSVGELEENHIGSNCGQYLERHLREKEKIPEGYSYGLESQEKKN